MAGNPREHRLGRARLVQEYLAHGAKWPDPVDTKWDRWYSEHRAYWDALSKQVGGSLSHPLWLDPLDDPLLHPELHPLGYPEDDVPRRMERATENATKNRGATENKRHATINTVADLREVLGKRGRPKTGKALSSTERSRQLRNKRKADKLPLPPRKDGWQDFKG